MLRKLTAHLLVLSLPFQIAYATATPQVLSGSNIVSDKSAVFENNAAFENNTVSRNNMATETNGVTDTNGENKTSSVTETKGATGQSIALVVNINTASAEEMATMLQGIGLKKAQEIVKFRNEHGAFQKIEDITKVKGIGSYLLEKNYARIQLQ